jgi:ABC-2 type transport system ATP-binding protein
MEASIEARALVKRYRRRVVLDGLDWTVAPGAAQALLAREGQGKTTLARLALGFIRPEGGSIRVLGAPAHRLPGIARRRLGYQAARPALRGEHAIEAVLQRFAAGVRSWDEELEARCRAAFDLGRCERVGGLDAVARRGLELTVALAPRPLVAVLDEPCREEGGGGRAAEVLAEVARRGETTLLVTAATAAEVEGFAREVAILHAGRLLERAPREELLREAREVRMPLELYVRTASLLARAGIIRARTVELEKRIVVRRWDGSLEAALRSATEGAAALHALDLGAIFEATIDVGSTGTGREE